MLAGWVVRGGLLFGLALAGCGGGSAAPEPDGDVVWATDASGDARTNELAVPETLPVGTWYLNVDGARRVLVLGWDRTRAAPGGTLADEPHDLPLSLVGRATVPSDATDPAPLADVAWDAAAHELRFRRATAANTEWYRARVEGAVLVGRVAVVPADTEPAATDWRAHVTGWNSTALDGDDIAPRVWDLLLDGTQHATLRVSRAAPPDTGFVATIKTYASETRGALDEGLEYDAAVLEWDGTTLQIATQDDAGRVLYTARVAGRRIGGVYVRDDDDTERTLVGTRANVLTYGLSARTDDARAAWQTRTRTALRTLMMPGATDPLAVTVTEVRTDLPPRPTTPVPPTRDDNPDAWPQAYTLAELSFASTAPGLFGGPIEREGHGYVARPTTPPPPTGYPAVVIVNGHFGSASMQLSPTDETYWFGESFARRGYVVVAVDVSHRPVADRGMLYGDIASGDDPAGGNGTHPAMASPGFDSDWVEDGERAWDAMRALDYVRSMPEVDPTRVGIVGLSMGGEVSTFTAALDPRVTVAVSAGYSPDLNVMYFHGNHPCWLWLHADVREYLDVSDLHALVAPRPLVVETGLLDATYSSMFTPYSADKQVLRRSAAAYAGASTRLVHYLHGDAHRFHVGDVNPALDASWGVQVPVEVAPVMPRTLDWQTNGLTEPDATASTLFDLLGALSR